MLRTFNAMKRQVPAGAQELDDRQIASLRQCLVGMLKDIASFCSSHGISFALCGGSALGAVREHGMIPWDDDIDICMPRADYERFAQLFTDECGEKYVLQQPGITAGYPLSLAKIRKRGTVYKTRDDFCCEECGVPVDLFIVENTYNDPVRRTLHGILSLAAGLALSCRKFCRDRSRLLSSVPDHNALRLKILLKIAVGALLAPLGNTDSWARRTDRIHSMCHDPTTRYITTPSGRYCFFREMWLREEYCSYRNEIFEGMELPVPLMIEKYFERGYGNWQTTPDTFKKEKHYAYQFMMQEDLPND